VRRSVAAALLGLVCASFRAQAQSANDIALDLPACLDATWRARLVESASLELREDGAVLAPSLARASREHRVVIAVDMPCESDPTVAQIHLTVPSSSDVLTREAQLSDTPPALRPRTLALALAELWRTSLARQTLSLQPTAAAPSSVLARDDGELLPTRMTGDASPPAASVPITVAPSSNNSAPRSDAPTLSLAPSLRLYIADRTALPGAQLAFSWRAWRIGAEGFYSSHEDVLGRATFGLLQAVVSWELARVSFGAYGLALGPRAAIGGIVATATARAPAFASSASILTWDAAGEATLWRMLTSSWRLALRVQLGYAHGAVLASDFGELARLDGLFAQANLALELHLCE